MVAVDRWLDLLTLAPGLPAPDLAVESGLPFFLLIFSLIEL